MKTNGHAATVSMELPAPAATAPAAAPETGLADALSPSHVRTWSDCPAKWYFKHGLRLPDPPTSSLAVGTAVHAPIAANFRYKRESKQDLETEGVVALFRQAWAEQLDLASFREDEAPKELGLAGEQLVRLYMNEAAPAIEPAEVELPVKGVIAGVRVRGVVDVIDVAGRIIDVKTAAQKPSSIDPLYRLQVATYRRLAPGASGLVQLDTLVKTKTPQRIAQLFEITDADIRATDAMYPLAQQGMRAGYYMPNRLSLLCSRRHCAFWRACEKEFGGTVDES